MPEARTLTRVVPAQAVGRYLIEDRSGLLPLLVGCHGYGENAEAHLEQLRRIPGAERFRLVSVQALHRFYNTKTGEVVASWMTKQDREQAIVHNIAYVARVVEEVEQEHGRSTRLVFAGFSQGVAMAYRAAARSPRPCHGVVVLGGDLPPDVAQDASAVLPPVLIGRGTRDSWYTEAMMARDLAALGARGARVETLVFAGGHEWTPAFLEAAGKFLDRV